MQRLKKSIIVLIVFLPGCINLNYHRSVRRPPVVAGWQQPIAGRNAYIVQKGDTLYSIAWAFDIDYRDLAKRNNLVYPYAIRYRQKIHIDIHTKFNNKSHHNKSLLIKQSGSWLWPAIGGVTTNLKGINIAGNLGDSILASKSGVIVYNGAGIPSYGNLIIIKHNDDYLSAYAYNKKSLVKEGQIIKAGEKIALMGSNNAGCVCLHFEIRKMGKPVNPILFLPKKP